MYLPLEKVLQDLPMAERFLVSFNELKQEERIIVDSFLGGNAPETWYLRGVMSGRDTKFPFPTPIQKNPELQRGERAVYQFDIGLIGVVVLARSRNAVMLTGVPVSRLWLSRNDDKKYAFHLCDYKKTVRLPVGNEAMTKKLFKRAGLVGPCKRDTFIVGRYTSGREDGR